MIKGHFLEPIAKITPRTERIVNTLIPNIKFASGPLTIKKKITLITTVNIDKTPNVLLTLLFKMNPPFLTRNRIRNHQGTGRICILR